MNTPETAKKLIAYINAGQNLQAEEELYAEDVVSYEQDGRVESGLPAIMAKTKAAGESFEAFHGGGVTQAYVGPDTLLLEITMDVTPKGGQRMTLKEHGYYRLNAEGKVVEERFFMTPLA